MKIKWLVSIAGPDCSYAPGEITDLPPEQAKAFADGVRAVFVRDSGIECAKPAPVETAAKRTKKA